MSVSRRDFIGGGTALLSMQAWRLRAAALPDAKSPLRLRFGVLSDIHVDRTSGDAVTSGDTQTFETALAYFRGRGVDGVVIAGDLAEHGFAEQLKIVGDAWFRVFPDDRLPNGRKVAKLFVTGNHDQDRRYTPAQQKRYPEKEECLRHTVMGDPNKAWTEAFHEPYEPIAVKEVKGYRFVLVQWDMCFGVSKVPKWYQAHAAEFDPKKPFFHIQHPHPKDTCYGPWAWGHDAGFVTKALSAFPNAVAFSGHSHYSLADERAVWQGAFTSIGTGSLRFAGEPYDMFPGEGFENTLSDVRCETDARKLMGRAKPTTAAEQVRSGLVVEVYDDRLVLERRDFNRDAERIGPDWTVPLPAVDPKPFEFASRAKASSAPEFLADARVSVTRGLRKRRNGKVTDAFAVTFPTVGLTGARVHHYDVVATGTDGQTLKVKHVLAPDWAGSPRQAPATATCAFAAEDLSAGTEPRFAVRAVNCFGKAGREITVK